MDSLFTEVLQTSASEMGFNLTTEQIAKCEAFADLVVVWNERMNLTSLVEPEEMALKHFVDSFTCLKAGTWPKGGRAIDVGTGAGFPGVPLAIIRPDMQWMLADALQKRIEFLRVAIAQLGLDQVECIHARAEELGRRGGLRENCDVAVARAVARMPVLLEYCLPLVRKGGGFLAMKGPEGEEEVAEGARVAKLLGGGHPEVVKLELPRSTGSRTLVWYGKLTKTPPAYPRRPGVPGKIPL